MKKIIYFKYLFSLTFWVGMIPPQHTDWDCMGSEQHLPTDMLEMYFDGLHSGDYRPKEASDSNA